MSLPRFSQSWSRSRYGGDIYSLLVEVGALIYLIPPIAGLIYARKSDFRFGQMLIVTVVFLITMYYGLSSGTRNILAVYVITFFGAYVLGQPKISLWKVGAQGGLVALGLLFVSAHMVEFRNVGIMNYSVSDQSRDTLFIDQNMVIITHLVNAFPSQYDYLGLEIPYHALIRPIPRALWPGKPEGLSASIEAVMGTSQATVASTFVGETYMAGGIIGILIAGLLFGAGAELWNRIGRERNSPFSQILYASGFFCAAISMRSMLWLTVTMLPTIALWVYGKLFLSRKAVKAQA
jgi:oligosaccharide repeat unit polymerase